MRPFVLASALAFAPLASLAACGASNVVEGHAPLSAAAQAVELVRQPPVKCGRRLGQATTHGREATEQAAEDQAREAAKAQVAQLGGDTGLVVTLEMQDRAGQGGRDYIATLVVEAYKCAGK